MIALISINGGRNNMKQFNLDEYLKNPDREIVTRAGCKVRILCTDRNHPTRPIIALAQIDGRENIYSYKKDGSLLDYTPSPSDLFFAPEKKTGWINVSRIGSGTAGEITYAGAVYPTKEEAIAGYSGVGLLDTIKIEWEE